VVGDLEEVHPREAGGEQLRIDRLLDIAHQQEPPSADLPGKHHGDVVDARAAVRWLRRHSIADGPQHPKADLVDGESVTRRDAGPDGSVTARQLSKPRGIARPGATHARLHHPPHVIPLEQQGQAGNVVLVRVRQDDRVDPAVPWWDPLIERDQEAIGIRPTVDQQPPAPRSLDEDRITLPDVEDRHPHDGGRASHDHAARDGDRGDQGHGRGATCRPAGHGLPSATPGALLVGDSRTIHRMTCRLPGPRPGPS